MATNFYVTLKEEVENIYRKESISKEVYVHSTTVLDKWYNRTTTQIANASQTKLNKEDIHED